MTQYILAIDQGTTSTRALLIDQKGAVVAQHQETFEQHFPQNGWVEHNPKEIWQTTLNVCHYVIEAAGGAEHIAAIGITNQRETTLIWDKATGETIYPAIVWQDRRTAAYCQGLKERGVEAEVSKKTGLLLDAYFSASKIAWILDNVSGARARAERGQLCFGTIDSFLIWHLSGGVSHVTDVTNASRTSLFNLKTLAWDADLLALFNIPESLLPQVLNNCDDFGVTTKKLFSRSIPITGVAGDQQAAAFGQACFEPGMIKSTYGTGCFMLVNTGAEIIHSQHKLLTTPLICIEGTPQYALEGSIFIAGAAVKWLHESLHLIDSPAHTEALAASVNDNHGVYLVPAFTGLGAPYWSPHARASLFGMTRDTGAAAIARATLESVCYQSLDLIGTMRKDGATPSRLRVDGGMTANAWFLQFLADSLDVEVTRPKYLETTALGAAFLAGLHCGFYASKAALSELWQCDQTWQPSAHEAAYKTYQRWLKAVHLTLDFSI